MDFFIISNILDCMNLHAIGRLIAEGRNAKGYTLPELAAKAKVGRSTLAALETGKLAELGFGRLARLCAAVDLVLEARQLPLGEPSMRTLHVPEYSARELTKKVIEDILTRGDLGEWRGLVLAISKEESGRIAQHVHAIAATLGRKDAKFLAYSHLLPSALRNLHRRA